MLRATFGITKAMSTRPNFNLGLLLGWSWWWIDNEESIQCNQKTTTMLFYMSVRLVLLPFMSRCLFRLEHWRWNIDITYCEILMWLLLRKALHICQTVYIRRDCVPVKYYLLFTTCIEAIYLHSSPHHKWIAYFNVNTKMKQACCATSSISKFTEPKEKKEIYLYTTYTNPKRSHQFILPLPDLPQ